MRGTGLYRDELSGGEGLQVMSEGSDGACWRTLGQQDVFKSTCGFVFSRNTTNDHDGWNIMVRMTREKHAFEIMRHDCFVFLRLWYGIGVFIPWVE